MFTGKSKKFTVVCDKINTDTKTGCKNHATKTLKESKHVNFQQIEYC